MADRTAHVALNQIDDLGGLGSEALNAELTIKKKGGDFGAVEEVLHIVVGATDLRFFPAARIDGDQLFVKRLKLFFRGLYFFVCALQFSLVDCSSSFDDLALSLTFLTPRWWSVGVPGCISIPVRVGQYDALP
jgi:hypothetical protein